MSSEIDSSAVRSSLAKLCRSSELRRSRQIVRLLTFMVEHALSDTDPLNERGIAEQVFDRNASWDPSEDTIVRTEMRRLRSKLDLYYEGEGKEDPVRIHLPRGGYLASFEQRSSPAATNPIPEARAAMVVAEAPPEAPRRRWTVPAAVVAVGVLAALLFFARHRERSAAAQALLGQPFANAVGQEFSPAFSPDGSTVAYVWDGDVGNLDIYTRDVRSGATKRLTTDAGDELYPAFSPDGKRLAYLHVRESNTELVVIDLEHGGAQTVTQIRHEIGRWAENISPLLGDPGPAWSSDGRALFVGDAPAQLPGANGLYSITLATGLRRQITQAPGEARDLSPAVSPDGHTLAFVRYLTHGVGEIMLLPLHDDGTAASAPTQLTHDGKLINGIAWLPGDGGLVASSNRAGPLQLWHIPLSGAPKLIPVNAATVAEPAVSLDGKQLAFVDSSENWNIWRAEIEHQHIVSQRRLLSSSGINKAPAYSPDGRQIAFLSDRSGRIEVWLANADGSSQRRISNFGGYYLGGISWSPSGKELAVDARVGGKSRIALLPTGGGDPKLLENDSFEERSPSWTAEGDGLYYNSNRGGEVAVWTRTLPSGSPHRVAPAPLFATHILPHGDRLYLSDTNGNIYTSARDGANLAQLDGAPRASPVSSWSLCTSGVYFSVDSTRQAAASLWFSASGKPPVRIGTTEDHLGVNSPDLTAAPDCGSLLYAQQDHITADIVLASGFDRFIGR